MKAGGKEREREREREGERVRGQDVPFKYMHPVTCFLQSGPPSNSPFSYELINGLIHR
jgi:hypothetical protein